jgi:two-component system response regulator FixJ
MVAPGGHIMPLSSTAPAAANASNPVHPGALALGPAVHARIPSEGHGSPVAKVSASQILTPAARVRPVANMSRPMAEPSKVVAIVTDHQMVEASLTSLLKGAGYRVVIFQGVDAFLAAELPRDPGCVLLDLQMPGADRSAVLREFGSRDMMPPVLVLSRHGDIHQAVEAMKLGAVDFLQKPYPPESLLAAIGNAVDIGPKRRSIAIDRDAEARIASLSQRELQVLQGIVKGKPNKIIAYELGISVRTVEAYRANLLMKLGVRGTADAVRLALAAGIL